MNESNSIPKNASKTVATVLFFFSLIFIFPISQSIIYSIFKNNNKFFKDYYTGDFIGLYVICIILSVLFISLFFAYLSRANKFNKIVNGEYISKWSIDGEDWKIYKDVMTYESKTSNIAKVKLIIYGSVFAFILFLFMYDFKKIDSFLFIVIIIIFFISGIAYLSFKSKKNNFDTRNGIIYFGKDGVIINSEFTCFTSNGFSLENAEIINKEGLNILFIYYSFYQRTSYLSKSRDEKYLSIIIPSKYLKEAEKLVEFYNSPKDNPLSTKSNPINDDFNQFEKGNKKSLMLPIAISGLISISLQIAIAFTIVNSNFNKRKDYNFNQIQKANKNDSLSKLVLNKFEQKLDQSALNYTKDQDFLEEISLSDKYKLKGVYTSALSSNGSIIITGFDFNNNNLLLEFDEDGNEINNLSLKKSKTEIVFCNKINSDYYIFSVSDKSETGYDFTKIKSNGEILVNKNFDFSDNNRFVKTKIYYNNTDYFTLVTQSMNKSNIEFDFISLNGEITKKSSIKINESVNNFNRSFSKIENGFVLLEDKNFANYSNDAKLIREATITDSLTQALFISVDKEGNYYFFIKNSSSLTQLMNQNPDYKILKELVKNKELNSTNILLSDNSYYYSNFDVVKYDKNFRYKFTKNINLRANDINNLKINNDILIIGKSKIINNEPSKIYLKRIDFTGKELENKLLGLKSYEMNLISGFQTKKHYFYLTEIRKMINLESEKELMEISEEFEKSKDKATFKTDLELEYKNTIKLLKFKK